MSALPRPHSPLQPRLFPDPITPAQAAFRRAKRLSWAVTKYGPGEDKFRTKQVCQALREGLSGE